MELLNPESPIPPPATSAFLVLIISSLSWKFLGFNPNIIGFILSVIFSVFWMNEFKLNILKRIFYIFINTILIFFTALGANTITSHPVLMNHSYSNTQINAKKVAIPIIRILGNLTVILPIALTIGYMFIFFIRNEAVHFKRLKQRTGQNENEKYKVVKLWNYLLPRFKNGSASLRFHPVKLVEEFINYIENASKNQAA